MKKTRFSEEQTVKILREAAPAFMTSMVPGLAPTRIQGAKPSPPEFSHRGDRETSSSCELPRRERLTADRRSRNLSPTGHSVDGPGGGMVFRGLIAALVVVASLLGIVQPAIACANCVPRTDCCPAGSLPGCSESGYQTASCTQADGCCALSTTVAPSVLAVKGRTPHAHVSAASAAIAPPAMFGLGREPTELRTLAARIPDPVNQSLTYLRTARLRL